MTKSILLGALLALTTSAMAAPNYDYEDNTMVLGMEHPTEDDTPSVLPLRCGFYDDSKRNQLTLYVVVGELYEIEGGAFYSDKLFDTRFIQVKLPYDQMGNTAVVDGRRVTVGYYDMLKNDWVLHAEEGTVTVVETAEHVYDVEVNVVDHTRNLMLGGHICHTDAWRWRDYNEERPNPNQFELKYGAEVREHHDILSCLVIEDNPDLPVIYLIDQPNITMLGQIRKLADDQYVIIQMPTSLMDGMIKGFSGWSDDELTVTYKGVDYNHSGSKNDETCYGGNVQMVTYDRDAHLIEINSTIYTMMSENLSNLLLHYAGSFVVNGEQSGIDNIDMDPSASTYYNLQGQRVNRPESNRIVIRNGKKVICL